MDVHFETLPERRPAVAERHDDEDVVAAIGNVVIEDENMRAVADEAERRGSSETMELRGNAAIHSREYSLSADVIFATLPEGSIGDVEATGDARLLGADLNVESPRIDLYFANDLLQRSVARADAALASAASAISSTTASKDSSHSRVSVSSMSGYWDGSPSVMMPLSPQAS